VIKNTLVSNNVQKIKIDNTNIPKVFWKYFDLFRRGRLSLSDFSALSELSEQEIVRALSSLQTCDHDD